ncbi:hypothetical protein Scep_000944 [Stephania cephalantha]|uniref:Uncharacterized protein n=1 Tax=Stephania cephalantha TaxID=152367 RepID=A0AAP0L8G4_9MAGN
MTPLVTSYGRSSTFDAADKENSQHLVVSSSSVPRPRQKRGHRLYRKPTNHTTCRKKEKNRGYENNEKKSRESIG